MNRPAQRTDPPSVRIVSELRRRIASGQLRAGDRVPSTRQITREWGVAVATATKVLAALRQEGLVRAVPGVGTVVDASSATPTPPPRTPRRHEAREAREAEPELTRDRVVRAAIGIADAEGLAALSMRRVASELGIATMSLYRYVPGKDELVLLMADAALGEDRLPEPPPAGWRAQLELSARLQWAVYRRHPWLAQVISMTRPQLLLNAVDHTEWALRAVDGLGLDPNAMLHAAVTMLGYVRGTAASLEPEAQAQQDTGITDDQWMESQESAMAQLLASGRFPTFASVAACQNLDLDLDSLFEFGLRQLLDGLAMRLQNPRT
jgi:DNA-binding transcriptional regulator YhcF (GntR family)